MILHGCYTIVLSHIDRLVYLPSFSQFRMQILAVWALVALLPYAQAQVPAYGQCKSN